VGVGVQTFKLFTFCVHGGPPLLAIACVLYAWRTTASSTCLHAYICTDVIPSSYSVAMLAQVTLACFFFNSTLLAPHLFPCVAPNSMSSSSLWHFDSLLATGACERIRRLRSIMLTILANPLIDEVLGELVHSTGDAMKLESYDGAVWHKGKGRDLGNYKYAFLYCSLYRLCRRGAFRSTERLFSQLAESYETLALNAPYTANMLSMKGDVIECVLSRSRITGVAIDPLLCPPRHALQKSFRDFDIAVDDIYRAVFCSWKGPPRGEDMPIVADFSALFLLAHTIHSMGEAVPSEWLASFGSLCRHAITHLLEDEEDEEDWKTWKESGFAL
jgi:hypothetical protein